MTLGEKILLLRKHHNLSQEKLAEHLHVSRQAVSKWELNAAIPDTENIVQLSRLFNVSTDYLLNDEYISDEDLPAVKQVLDEKSEFVKEQLEKNKAIYTFFGFVSLFIGVIAFSVQLYLSARPDMTFSFWLRPLLFALPIWIITILSFTLRKKIEESVKAGTYKPQEKKVSLSLAVAGAALGSIIGLVYTLVYETAEAVFVGIGLGSIAGILLDALRHKMKHFAFSGVKKHHIYAAVTAAFYFLIYIVCRKYLYHLYTPDWTADNILWVACIISVLPGLFGAYRFSWITLAGYLAGVILGEMFGPTMRIVQEGQPPMPYHDGWFYCIATYIVSCLIGIACEIYSKGKKIKSD